jgi:hypothetical protein
MNNILSLAVAVRRALRFVGRVAWKLILAAAPLGNLNWIVGMPPYQWR